MCCAWMDDSLSDVAAYKTLYPTIRSSMDWHLVLAVVVDVAACRCGVLSLKYFSTAGVGLPYYRVLSHARRRNSRGAAALRTFKRG